MAPDQNHQKDVSILDIRRNEIQSSMIDELHSGLRPPQGGEKRMPTMLLYDERGLKLFEAITYLEEYYLTNAEIEVLERYADHIAERIHNGSQVVELGSGNLRKVDILLQALDRAGKRIDYYALDLSLSELQRTLSAVPKGTYSYVHCHGLLGTYDDGLEWLKLPQNDAKPKCILHLGSSIGNFNRDEAAQFLKGFAETLKPKDVMLIGIDGCQDRERVYHAYNDREGKTHEFVRNGLVHANELLGKEAFRQTDWEVVGEYDEAAGRHQAFYVPLKDIELDGIRFMAGERVRIEESYKYSEIQTEQLWEAAGLAAQAVFGDYTGQYRIHMVTAPEFTFSLNPLEYAAKPVPTLHEFEQLWAAWDTVTKRMIPNEELLSKPIKLRNCCLFYLGHIPTFLDIHLTRATNGEPTVPSSYPRFFQRGIDPDVDNPEQCHAHSETPDSWPPVHEISTFQEDVRDRVRKLYTTNLAETNRKVGRALWIGFEHEAMHLETLLYMLLQSEKTVPPPGIQPDFEALADQARIHSVPNQWITVPTRKVTIGLTDADDDFGPDRYFGWDCEKPVRSVTVPGFEAKARPITNEDYGRYLAETHDDADQSSWPASWTVRSQEGDQTKQNGLVQLRSNGGAAYMNGDSKPLTEAFLKGKAVRTVYGPVPLKHALAWPVIASYDELAGCANWMNGRIPTMEEARSLYDYTDERKAKDKGEVRNGTIPAVNGHLSNDGVEESPPSHPSRKSNSNTEFGLNPKELFANLEGCNVGFKHFHPIPVTQNGDKLSGQGEMGGVWEWTSSVLEKHDGFEPMPLYPEYSADFFDGKHNIVLGGSWATHPRIAGRKSFVNWYQRNYLYAWAGARLVRNL